MAMRTRVVIVIRACLRITCGGRAPAKKKKPNEPGKNDNPLITKLTKTLQLTEHVGPAIDGELASLVDKIEPGQKKRRRSWKQHETPENSTTLSELKLNQGVWHNLHEWTLIKGKIVIVSEVNKLIGNSAF